MASKPIGRVPQRQNSIHDHSGTERHYRSAWPGQEMYRALRQEGVPVELVTYPRENHGPLAIGMLGHPSPEPWHGYDARQRIVASSPPRSRPTPPPSTTPTKYKDVRWEIRVAAQDGDPSLTQSRVGKLECHPSPIVPTLTDHKCGSRRMLFSLSTCESRVSRCLFFCSSSGLGNPELLRATKCRATPRETRLRRATRRWQAVSDLRRRTRSPLVFIQPRGT